MSEGLRVAAFAAAALALAIAWLSVRTTRLAASSPDRLVAELRLAQLAALLLTLVAGAYVGFAAAGAERPGAGLDVALAVGFFVVAGLTMTREPREALTTIAVGFVAHALLDTLHRPGMLSADLAPRWYAVGCATFNVLIGGLCYLPVFRR